MKDTEAEEAFKKALQEFENQFLDPLFDKMLELLKDGKVTSD